MASKGISGLAVAVVGLGAVLVWSGVNNQDFLTVLRTLAMGKPVPEGPQVKSAFRPTDRTGETIPKGGSSGSRVVDIAASYEGHPYIFGGGHGDVCPDGGMDCSGYVSCVLNKAGFMEGTLTTSGFKNWGLGVRWEDRRPGDIAVWVGGPGGGHMGIIADDKRMWHNPCTGCGGVTMTTYGKTRTGRATLIRRARGPV